jgi:hypothetical protein
MTEKDIRLSFLTENKIDIKTKESVEFILKPKNKYQIYLENIIININDKAKNINKLLK